MWNKTLESKARQDVLSAARENLKKVQQKKLLDLVIRKSVGEWNNRCTKIMVEQYLYQIVIECRMEPRVVIKRANPQINNLSAQNSGAGELEWEKQWELSAKMSTHRLSWNKEQFRKVLKTTRLQRKRNEVRTRKKFYLATRRILIDTGTLSSMSWVGRDAAGNLQAKVKCYVATRGDPFEPDNRGRQNHFQDDWYDPRKNGEDRHTDRARGQQCHDPIDSNQRP